MDGPRPHGAIAKMAAYGGAAGAHCGRGAAGPAAAWPPCAGAFGGGGGQSPARIDARRDAIAGSAKPRSETDRAPPSPWRRLPLPTIPARQVPAQGPLAGGRKGRTAVLPRRISLPTACAAASGTALRTVGPCRPCRPIAFRIATGPRPSASAPPGRPCRSSLPARTARTPRPSFPCTRGTPCRPPRPGCRT